MTLRQLTPVLSSLSRVVVCTFCTIHDRCAVQFVPLHAAQGLYKRSQRCRILSQRLRIAPLSIVRRSLSVRATAPEGGAHCRLWYWVRGCFAAAFMASYATAQTVPSGHPISLEEVLIDEVGAETFLRFRFLAPHIARGLGASDQEAVSLDLDALCRTVALPYMAEHALSGDVIVIGLMDRPVAFGTSDPDATQFIEAYLVEGDTCVLQVF